jgi:RNA polymerase sigma factor (sigma-70 family)
MDPHGSVTRLVHDLRSDDPAVRNGAAQRIWDRYFPRLLGLAREELDGRIRHRADEEDVLQSMFNSFCARQGRGGFDLADRDDLWKLLVTITLNKARNVNRENFRGRRSPLREQAPPGDDEAQSARWALEQMDTAGPSPAEAAELNEALQQRLAALADPELVEIALLRLEGYTNREIAEKRGCVERTIERKVDRIKARWGAIEGEAP